MKISYLKMEWTMSNSNEANLTDHFNSDKLFTRKQYYFYIISSLEIFIALIGNTLFLVVMIKYKTALSSNMYVIMSSLSVVDIVGAVALSGHAIRDFLIHDYRTQYNFCRYMAFLISSSSAGNMYHLLLMSIDRYVAVALPLR